LSARSHDIAAALAEAARTINTPTNFEETLQSIVEAAPDTVPGFRHVSVSVANRDGSVETGAASDDLVVQLDQVQYDAGEGPCFDAITHGGAMIVEDVRHEQRWPTYIKRAIEAGVTAQMGLQLHHADRALGGLNLYRTAGPGIDPEALEIADIFATHAAVALARSRTEQQLTTALSTRTVIGQAMGIVMERYQLDEDRAFSFLVRASSTRNIKLREVAQELVNQAKRRRDDEDGRP
jgi:GAF domain-containing protein